MPTNTDNGQYQIILSDEEHFKIQLLCVLFPFFSISYHQRVILFVYNLHKMFSFLHPSNHRHSEPSRWRDVDGTLISSRPRQFSQGTGGFEL